MTITIYYMNPFPTPPGHSVASHRITDEEMEMLLKSYLRPDQIKNSCLVRFILKYVECRNTKQAAEHSGIGGNGYYWRSRPEVHALIEAIDNKSVMKYGYDASEIIERVKEISDFDPIVFLNPDGSYKSNLAQIPPEARRAIKKLKVRNTYGQDLNGMPVVTGQIIEIETWDKQKAHDQLGSEKNIFKKTTVVEHDVTQNMASLLLESGKRAEERKALMSRPVIEHNPYMEVTNERVEETNSDRDEPRGTSGPEILVDE